MNKNVIRAMIYLVCVYLCAWYVLKFSFPEQFVLKINNPSIIKFGQYVDSHIALKRFLNTITAFITYWLFLCAVTHKPYLSAPWCLILISNILISFAVDVIDTNISAYYGLLSMVALGAIWNCNARDVGVVLIVHSVSQLLSLSIRGLSQYIVSANYATFILMTSECYFWLLLLYLYYNYEEVVENGSRLPAVLRQRRKILH